MQPNTNGGKAIAYYICILSSYLPTLMISSLGHTPSPSNGIDMAKAITISNVPKTVISCGCFLTYFEPK
jgi:hypothetical protein